MNGTLLPAIWLLPLILAPLAVGAAGRWWLPLATVPAVVAGLFVPVDTTLDVPWLLLGVHLGLDGTGRLFLLFSALLWLFAGVYTAFLPPAPEDSAGRFRLLFLLAMGGNFLLILAADMVTFYVGFALMGLAAYGLVVHRRSPRARRAARVYLAWTLVGEVALFSALVLLAAGADSLRFTALTQRELPMAAVALLLFGFGIKVALPGLHVWLPLAYPAAPAVAAAVLSGPMIKAGLLGWLRFLPADSPGLGGPGMLLTVLGAAGVALGVLVGVSQRDPRAVLAYSSIAKMGLVSAVFGTAISRPETGPAIATALVLFAMQHLVVKGALFLGVGEWERAGRRPWVLAGLGGLSLAMVGVPLTGGAAAKSALDSAVAGSGADLALLFLASAIGTVLLMTRFLWLVARAGPRETGNFGAASLSWLILAVAALWLPSGPAGLSLSVAGLVPLGAGLTVAAIAWAVTRGRVPAWNGVPPGDLLHLLPRRRRRKKGWGRLLPPVPVPLRLLRLGQPGHGELPMATAGLLWLSLFALLLAAILIPA